MGEHFKVKIADCDHESIDIERSILRDISPDIPWLRCKTEDDVIAQCSDAQALLIQYVPMTDRVFENLPNLRVLVRYGVGVDTVDLEAAARRKIVVSNVPDYGTEEVSDHALALILSLSRKIQEANAFIHRGTWDFRTITPVRRLQTLTLGVIGLGRIGSALARKAHGIGIKIVAYDPYRDKTTIPEYVRMIPLDGLLNASDVVSIHCPLNDETRNLLDEHRLGLMKTDAFLINTARGSIVNEVALEKALSQGRIAGAALDVFSKEPVLRDHPLLRFPNFICTPHMAWYSEDSKLELKRKAAEEARRVLMGETPKYQVNRF